MSIKKFLILPIAVAFMAFGIGSAANAQVAASPVLAVQLATTGLTNPLTAGASGATLARLVLDTTGSNTPVRVASLPLSLTLGNNASASTLNNCAVVNENTGATLSSGANVPAALVSGMNTFTLDTPIVLPANTVTTLDVRCNIGSNLVTGGTYQFSLNTANVVASDPTTGTPATVVLRGATPVTIPVPVTVPVVVPTVPNTGAGGEAPANVAIILGALAAATLGLAYARKASVR